ncbi:hypothetical protein R80B4_01971 [Fibrobacteres bacterium R8-0-B4]
MEQSKFDNPRIYFKNVLPFILLYFSANALFIYKYGARTSVGSYPGVLAYTVFLAIALPFYLKILRSKIEKLKTTHFTVVYFGILCLFVFSALFLLFKIDPYSVDVDRWSAIHGFLKNLFAGEFPYLARSHLGSLASPLPVMNFIAIPFYLTGDVGYLQVFIFALTAVVVFLAPLSKSGKMLFMLAFLLSPAFWYEVVVRSDLVSNILIICLCLLFIEKITNGKPLDHPIKAGCICGALFCTRGVFIIPFTVFFFAKTVLSIKETGFGKAFIFAICVFITFALFLLPFVLWDIELFTQNNPFLMQTNKSPVIVSAMAIALAALLSFNVRSVGHSLLRTAICLFALMGATMIIKVFTVGWNAVIFSHRFDITYYSTIIPFIILGVLFEDDFFNLSIKEG